MKDYSSYQIFFLVLNLYSDYYCYRPAYLNYLSFSLSDSLACQSLQSSILFYRFFSLSNPCSLLPSFQMIFGKYFWFPLVLYFLLKFILSIFVVFIHWFRFFLICAAPLIINSLTMSLSCLDFRFTYLLLLLKSENANFDF